MACRDCFAGSLHDGIPTGRTETLHGLPCYIADPRDGEDAAKAIIVIIPDAFGWELPNTRILADAYARGGGWQVLVPEFMDGHYMRHDVLWDLKSAMDGRTGLLSKIIAGFRVAGSFGPFIWYNRLGITTPRVMDFFRALRTSTSHPIGAAGFCWGGKHAVDLCSTTFRTSDASDGRPLIDCAFTAHPSLLSIPADFEAVTLPLAVAIGTKDHRITPAHQVVIEEIFAKKTDGGVHCEMVAYEGATHGFAVRASPEDEAETRMGKEAEDQAINWFTRCFRGQE